MQRNWNKSSVLGKVASLILKVTSFILIPPLIKKKTLSTQIWSGFHEETGPCEKSAKQLQGNIWTGTSNIIYNNFAKLFSQRDV